MNRIYRVIWNCTLQVFQACSELTRRAGKTSTVNLRKSSGLTTKFSRLTLGVLLALSGSASGASLEVDNDQITNIDTDVAYDAYLVGWYGTGVLNILAGGNASLTTTRHSRINEQCRRLHADQCAQRRWLDASAAVILRQDVWLYPCNRD